MKKLMILATLIIGFSLNAQATATNQSNATVKIITKRYWPSSCSNNSDNQENCSSKAQVTCSKTCPASNNKCTAPITCFNGYGNPVKS